MPSDILLNERSLYDAIYWHTTGNPSGGDALGHVVFLADELDPILSTGANDRTWRGRSPSLTVIAIWYSIYCERWGGWDTSPVANRGAPSPSEPEV